MLAAGTTGAQSLPGTKPLTSRDDISVEMVHGIGRFHSSGMPLSWRA
jgi:hypothetical protein